MPTSDTQWSELRRIADELELKIHLASMDARDRWASLKPRLTRIERMLERTGERAAKVVQDEVQAIEQALRELRADLARGKQH